MGKGPSSAGLGAKGDPGARAYQQQGEAGRRDRGGQGQEFKFHILSRRPKGFGFYCTKITLPAVQAAESGVGELGNPGSCGPDLHLCAHTGLGVECSLPLDLTRLTSHSEVSVFYLAVSTLSSLRAVPREGQSSLLGHEFYCPAPDPLLS